MKTTPLKRAWLIMLLKLFSAPITALVQQQSTCPLTLVHLSNWHKQGIPQGLCVHAIQLCKRTTSSGKPLLCLYIHLLHHCLGGDLSNHAVWGVYKVIWGGRRSKEKQGGREAEIITFHSSTGAMTVLSWITILLFKGIHKTKCKVYLLYNYRRKI